MGKIFKALIVFSISFILLFSGNTSVLGNGIPGGGDVLPESVRPAVK